MSLPLLSSGALDIAEMNRRARLRGVVRQAREILRQAAVDLGDPRDGLTPARVDEWVETLAEGVSQDIELEMVRSQVRRLTGELRHAMAHLHLLVEKEAAR